MPSLRTLVGATLGPVALLTAACGASAPASPGPLPGETPTVNVYILPGAVELGSNAFGDHPIVIYRGERMRLFNADSIEHTLVADTRALPEFLGTGAILAPGGERTSIMNTLGTTTFHCVDHPQMTGTLIVLDR